MVTGAGRRHPVGPAGHAFARFLAPVFPLHEGGHGGFAALLILVLAVLVFAAGFALALVHVHGRPHPRRRDRRSRRRRSTRSCSTPTTSTRSTTALIVRPLLALSVFLARVVRPRRSIDGLVNGSAARWWRGRRAMRRLQTGYTVNYALTMLAGAVAVVAFLLSR